MDQPQPAPMYRLVVFDEVDDDDRTAVRDLFCRVTGMHPTDANQWILFSTANAAFSQIVAGIRSHDVAEEIALRGPFTLGASRQLDGYAVDAIRGTLEVQGAKPARAVLYVRASGRPLPVEEDTVGAQGQPNGEDHIVFSQWGEQVRPKAPDATITFFTPGTSRALR